MAAKKKVPKQVGISYSQAWDLKEFAAIGSREAADALKCFKRPARRKAVNKKLA